MANRGGEALLITGSEHRVCVTCTVYRILTEKSGGGEKTVLTA